MTQNREKQIKAKFGLIHAEQMTLYCLVNICENKDTGDDRRTQS